MTESSLLSLAAALLPLMFLGALGFWFKRVLDQNDQAHKALAATIDELHRSLCEKMESERQKQADDDKDLEEKISRLCDALASEKDARQRDLKDLSDKIWELKSEIGHDYISRRESMRQYGTLLQRIDRLPCRQPACPGSQKE